MNSETRTDGISAEEINKDESDVAETEKNNLEDSETMQKGDVEIARQGSMPFTVQGNVLVVEAVVSDVSSESEGLLQDQGADSVITNRSTATDVPEAESVDHQDRRLSVSDDEDERMSVKSSSLSLHTNTTVQNIQLGEDLQRVANQDGTPTPDTAPVAPFSNLPAYSQVSTVYSPTHTTHSDWSGSEATRHSILDDSDVPSPMSNDGWKSGMSEQSYGDRSYSPTTPVHSDWTSGPSTPTSQPESPGETDTPWEILVRGDKAVEAYITAARYGTKKVYRTRVMLVGQERVGKTSLLKSLVGREHNIEEDITDGVDTTTICKVPMKDCSTPWVVQHTDKTDRVQHLHSQYNKAVGSTMAQELLFDISQDSQDFHKTMEEEDRNKLDSNIVTQSLEAEFEHDKTVYESGDHVPHLSPRKGTVTVPPEVTEEVLQSLERHSSLATEDSSSQGDTTTDAEEESVLEFQFWDFAGQNTYYTTHQVFLNRRAIFVLVYDASQDLKSHSKIEGTLGHKQEQSRYHDFTGLDFLHFWLQSVYAYTATESDNRLGKQSHGTPPVFVVGTHRDSCTHDMEASVDSQHELIYNAIEDKPYEQHVIRHFHMIENSLENKQDSKLCDLRRHIADKAMKESYMGEKIPLRWLQFEKAVLETVAKGTTHMKIDKVRELAISFKIKDSREFYTMLQFYHDLGCIIYFGGSSSEGKPRKELRDVVILDPQWLIDVFKRVITVKPNSKQLSKYCVHWRRLHKEGILDEELLDHVWQDYKELKTMLISLMEMFDLLCPQCLPAKGAKEEKTYCVPACLQLSSEQDKIEDRSDNGTFYIDFEEFLPDGLFHRVLIHISRWSQERGKRPPKLRYRYGKFYIRYQKAMHIVRLSMRSCNPACIKVTVQKAPVLPKCRKRNATDELCPQVCIQVQKKLESVLRDMKQTWIHGIQYKFRVACEACNESIETTQLHLLCFYECTHAEIDEVFCDRTECSLSTENYKKRFKFTESSAKNDDERYSQNLADNPDGSGHLNANNSTTSQSNHTHNLCDGCVTDRQLSMLADKMGVEWKQFGLEHLDMTKADIDHCLCDDPQGTLHDHIFAMLHRWKCKCGMGALVTVLVDKLREFEAGEECCNCFAMP